MRIDREKLGFFMLAAASLVGVVILVAALNGFAFASPYQLAEAGSEGGRNAPVSDEMMRLIVFLVWVLLPLFAVMLILAARRRRRMLLFLLVIVAVAYLISTSNSGELLLTEAPLGTITPEVLQSEAFTPQPTLQALPPVEDVGVTPALVWLLSLGLGGILLGLVVVAWLFWRALRRPPSTLQAIVASAETALQALEQGEDVQGAVLRCYRTMLAAAVEAKGVERPEYLTPAEFIQRLVQAGLPRGPVERLTHLFEAVRFSAQPSTAAMEAEAVLCLQNVVAATKGEA